MSGNNKIEVDEPALSSEIDSILAGAQPDAPALNPYDEANMSIEPQNDSWVVMCGGIVPVVSITLLPQWNLTEGEQKELATSLGVCLDQVFPGGMDGRYACWVRLLACCGGIAVTRAMSNGGKLPGIGPRVEKKVSEPIKNAAPTIEPAKELSDAEKLEAALQGT